MISTAVFADLTGHTGVFEPMGNTRATEQVTQITRWIARVCGANGGEVVKTQGSGVLMLFRHPVSAIDAVRVMQRGHARRLQTCPLDARMALQIGVASGDVVKVGGDPCGDAVNLASRLSDLAGPGQIWVTESVVQQMPHHGQMSRRLGAIAIRGRQDAPIVYRIDWQEDYADPLTRPSPLGAGSDLGADTGFGQIELAWLNLRARFNVDELPITLGRVGGADFLIADPRVSRWHARLELHGGRCVLVDISTYGTWVRLHGAEGAAHTEVALRRGECVLQGSGEIALGASFGDFTAPTVSFKIGSEDLSLLRGQPATVCR